jgi:hypothetical protein
MKNLFALALLRFFHFGGGRSGGAALLMIFLGLLFAIFLVWVIQRSGRSTI